MTQPPTEPNPDYLLSTREAAAIVGLKAQSLRAQRTRGGPIPYIRVSANRCGYRMRDLLAFLDSRTFTSTAQEHAAKSA